MNNYKLVKNTEWKKIELNDEEKLIPNEWERVNVKESIYLKARIGWQGLKSSEFIKEGLYYCVTGQDFLGNAVDWKNCYKVTPNRYEQDTKIQLQNKDILITKDGTIGKIAKINCVPDGHYATLNSGVFVSRAKKFSQEYWYFILKGEIFNNFVKKQKSGSTIAHLNQGKFESLEFLLPPKFQQFSIASILSEQESIIQDIESLISKYESRFQYLSEEFLLGRLRVKEVDGEVVIYKNSEDNWKEVEINGEIKEIPKDWEVEMINKIIKIINGFPFKGTDFFKEQTNYPIIRIRDLLAQEIQTYYKGVPNDKMITIKKGDLLVGMDGDFNIVEWKQKDVLLNQRILKIDILNSNNKYFIKELISKVLNEINQKTLATTVKHLSSVDFLKKEILVPKNIEQSIISSILLTQELVIENEKKLLNKEKQKFDWLLDNLLYGKYLVKELL